MRFSTIVSVVTLVWGISPRQPSGKNIIRWLLKKRTNGSVRYCQYTSEFIFLASSDRYKKYLSKRDEAKVIVETERLFNSLSIQEKEVLAFAVMANNKIVLKHGDPVALSLMRKGLLHRSGVTYSASGKEKFVIPDVWFHECYMRFAGKADELI
ncbi:super-infection exclusion protein B [Escherichia coli]|uniref:super-infection exclusion protein B n=1 Tax=Escherichia coli TaxID=562 RepID=UPI0004DAC065|nr:super-infection exclusion protein B [Escherichia coli]KDV35376.1 hypothetical protein BU59_37470 [Escherichia coli O69:H11 str. 07-3763]